jgi:hypothetical protein
METLNIILIVIVVLLVGIGCFLAYSVAASRLSLANTIQQQAIAGDNAAAVPATLVNYVEAIPLTWSSSVYTAAFTVGVSPVTAVLDSGSAEFVVAMQGCASCTDSTYNPTASSTAVLLIDPRLAALANITSLDPKQLAQYSTILCRQTTSYVSQSDSIQMYQDVVTFPRRTLHTPDLCPGSGSGSGSPAGSVSLASSSTKPTDALVITNFPVGAVYAVTGSSNLNVLGMSAVLATTKIQVNGQTVFLMPSCQTIAVPAHESPVISALAMHYGDTADLIWSMYLYPGEGGGWLVFGPMVIPCRVPAYVNMVQQLPNAAPGISATPMRYYVVAVARMYIRHAHGGTTVLSDAPSLLLVDTGTTLTMLPGEAGVQTILNMDPVLDSLVLVLGDSTSTVTLRYSGATLGVGTDDPKVTILPPATAAAFSSALDVGILGCTWMRNMYLEFNVTKLKFGFGAPLVL